MGVFLCLSWLVFLWPCVCASLYLSSLVLWLFGGLAYLQAASCPPNTFCAYALTQMGNQPFWHLPEQHFVYLALYVFSYLRIYVSKYLRLLADM